MTCIIIEDELPAQEVIKNYIFKIPQLELLESFQSALEANQFLKHTPVTLIFLDINLPDISGIAYVKTLANPPKIIITTAYPEHALESFELLTICDYLVKPFSFERFLKGVNKISNKSENYTHEEAPIAEKESIFINVDKTLHKVCIDDIVYIASDRNYITLVTKNKKLSYVASLKNWMETLPENHFIQIHKSYVINRKKIDKIAGNRLFIADLQLPIGRNYKASLLKSIKN